jgi:hypothetical protein
MSFLDGLENTLKALESQEERDPARVAEAKRRRDEEKAKAQAAAPFADQLKSGPFTAALLEHAVRIGHGQRTKVHITWLGTTLRLDAREKRMELVPGADGVIARFSEAGQEKGERAVDLDGDAEAFARSWLEA